MRQSQTKPANLSHYILLLMISVIPLLFTLPLAVIDIDSAQYAEIAREMLQRGEYFILKDNGRAYLDKPILTFWTIALSFKLFGINNFAFRIPAILITFLASWSIFHITSLISGPGKGSLLNRPWIAAITYLSAPGVYSMVVDPKIDVYLTAFLVFTHHAYYLGVKRNKNWYYLMYLFMGLGFITKGPISAVIPAISIGGDILMRRDFQRLREMKLLAGIPLLALFPGIWSYFLYQEYSSYGPVFFLWIQSFGRFYRKMYDQKLDPVFFYSNFAWAFGVFILPMAVFLWQRLRIEKNQLHLIESVKSFLRDIKENKFKDRDFVIPFWLFLFLFLISFSRFQLPQYIFWILPAAAVYFSGMMEKFLTENLQVNQRLNYVSFLLVPAGFILLIVILPIYTIEMSVFYGIVLVLFAFIVYFIFAFIFALKEKFFFLPVIVAGLFFTIFSLFLYPELLKYQPSEEVGKVIQKLEPGKDRVYTFFLSSSKRSYAFYSRRLTKMLYDRESFYATVKADGTRLVLMPGEMLPLFAKYFGKLEIEEVGRYKSYKVATPTVEFFNRLEREGGFLLKPILLIRVKYDEAKKEEMPTFVI